MLNYSNCALVSQKNCLMILSYYKDLYRNYEMKYTSHIAKDLHLSTEIVKRCIDYYIRTEEAMYSELGTMIMLCTKFDASNQYYEVQQRIFGELIEQRKIMKEQKDRHDMIAQMVKERSAEYMKKRKNK